MIPPENLQNDKKKLLYFISNKRYTVFILVINLGFLFIPFGIQESYLRAYGII
jgi:hypothetical protein